MARISNEQLKQEYPSFTYPDIGAVLYGDVPAYTVDGSFKYDDAIERFIMSVHGAFHCYNTLKGKIYIDTKGNLLWGEHTVKYKGKCIQVVVDKMYGENALYLSYISTQKNGNKWWGNSTNIFCFENPMTTFEMDKDDVENILSRGDSDYGVSVSKLFEMANELYRANPNNALKEVQNKFVNRAKEVAKREAELEAEWKNTQCPRVFAIYNRLIAQRDGYIDKGDYCNAFKSEFAASNLKSIYSDDYVKGQRTPNYIVPPCTKESLKWEYSQRYSWKSNFNASILEDIDV